MNQFPSYDICRRYISGAKVNRGTDLLQRGAQSLLAAANTHNQAGVNILLNAYVVDYEVLETENITDILSAINF